MTSGVVVVGWNGEQYLENCLSSVLVQTLPPTIVIVVDNASADRSGEIVRAFETRFSQVDSRLTLFTQTTNTGFTRGANTGLRTLLRDDTAVEFAVLLNQDATLQPRWCETIAAVLNEDQRVGVVGSKILHPNGLTIQHAGAYLETPRMVGRHWGHHLPDQDAGLDSRRDVEYVTAAAVALRSGALREVGLFDEIFSPGYYEDVDLCARMRAAGWRVQYSPDAMATHVESGSFAKRSDRLALVHRNRLIYALPWLVEPSFRAQFCRAERQYFSGDAPSDDRRALALAYLSVMLMLPEGITARVPLNRQGSDLPGQLIEMLADLRRELLERGLAR